MADTVGGRIRAARDTYGINQTQLAPNLGVTRAAISQYEQDQIRPRPEVFEALARYFLSDPAWFEHGEGEPPSKMNAPVLTLKLTWLEAKGLLVCADEGAEGLLTDPSAARSYVGGPQEIEAASRALAKLRDLLNRKDAQ